MFVRVPLRYDPDRAKAMEMSENSSIYLVRERIVDRKELRRLRRLPAMGMRGPDDLTGSDGDLFCPGGFVGEVNGASVIVWELRRWSPELNSDPTAVARLSTWHHLLAEGFRVVTDKAELEGRTGWKQD